MLINFQVKNFASFWRPSNFSMVASPVRRHPSHVAEIGGHNILRSAFVFGANAGGKSNFVRAIGFVKRIVVDGMDGVSCDQRYFRLAPKEIDDIGVFQFTIFAGDNFYEFGLAISYGRASIVSEWLTLVKDDGTQQQIYVCDWAGASPTITTSIDLEPEERVRFNVYCDDAKNMSTWKKTFLSGIAEKGRRRNASGYFSHFSKVYFWFRKLKVIFPETVYGGMIRYVIDESARLSFGALLNHFDTGIEKLLTQTVDAEKVLGDLPADKRSELKSKLIADLTHDKNSVVRLTTPDNDYLVHYQEGKLFMEKIVADHGKKDDPFDRADESDGTRRLYDLLPLQRMFGEDTVVFVDELDRSLHTKATIEFIKTFFERSDGHRSQLIATTHDASVLDLGLIRQDEIWFVERGEDHSSNLFPLTQFKPRFDNDIQKGYLLGRYGALPIFRYFRTKRDS